MFDSTCLGMSSNNPLASAQPGCDAYARIRRDKVRCGAEQFMQRSVLVERHRVKQQVECLERKQERTGGDNLLQPLVQVSSHDHQQVLQLAAGICSDL